MLQQLSGTSSVTAVSDYEEHIWMLQLQQPEQVHRQVSLWKIEQNIDQTLLEKVIQHIVQTTPYLNIRYKFSDDGELYKFPVEDWSSCFKFQQLNIDNIIKYIEKIKSDTWNAEVDSPFFTHILETEQGIFIVLMLHPILDQSYEKSDFIKSIKTIYANFSSNHTPLRLTEADTLIHDSHKNTGENKTQLDKTYISEIILDEFRSTLAEPDMTLNDDFFDFGGHSLLATRIIGNLSNKHGIEIRFNDFFKSPTAIGLAEYTSIKSAQNQQDMVQNTEQAPLTLAQDFLWQAYSAFDFSPIYNLPFAVEFLAEVDENVLFQAFTDIIERHVGLRTLFQTQNGETIQRAVPISELNKHKWFWDSNESQHITLSDEASYKFDLSQELPLRVRIIREPDNNQQKLSFLVHHMVIDEWSLNTIMSDLAQAYFARANGHIPDWKTPAQSIHDFSILQKKQGIHIEHIQYWTDMLTGATKGLTFNNTNHPAPSQQNTPQVKWLELKFEPEMYKKISAFSRQQNSSIFSVIYTAIVLALHHQGNLKELVVGTSASGRTDPNFFDSVGYFTTMVAHRVLFNSQQSFESLLQNISTMINNSMAYADIPINHIQKALGMLPEDGLLFDVFIHIHSNNALNGVLKNPQGQDIPYRQILPERNESMFGLHFEIMENLIDEQYELSMIITYQAHRFSTTLLESIVERIKTILDQI
ncbi:condensation domain-containing protein [Acinetobacter stercoris]|uniref:Dimodular nonribosomal peptide synthase n=1 Tax=Acinetobacter stercoris TaxID=2126983 RepID=A0A2U3MZ99_9GAMM|nr:condensation domain-containing protein [Acinetobacter stercoris]SPL70747.1 Dimodular nonribosomal peptide synthase [Acinetobacter stercoris]